MYISGFRTKSPFYRVQSLVCIDKDESQNIFAGITSVFLVDLFSFFNIHKSGK